MNFQNMLRALSYGYKARRPNWTPDCYLVRDSTGQFARTDGSGAMFPRGTFSTEEIEAMDWFVE